MLKIAYFEEKTLQMYRDGAMSGPTHLYIGEEACVNRCLRCPYLVACNTDKFG
ncbi:MAG: hypothetical protein HYX92_06680 [Chloroflexi bacterium]|nr:hypothetical protein [Chloroflexota bacterium]